MMVIADQPIRATMYKYQFTSTVEDLLEAEEAERTGRLARAPFRWVIVLLGVAWLVAGVLAFDWSNPSWRPIVWMLLGTGVIYYFIIKSYFRRRQIKEYNASQQDLVLEFHDTYIKLEVSGVDEFTRKWEDLVEFINARKGIIFYFSDGVVNWIPNRVFADREERNRFINFVQRHQSKES